MGIGIGIYCKICGEQLTSLDSHEAEAKKICKKCKKCLRLNLAKLFATDKEEK